MEVKRTRKIRGFLSIELMLVLTITAILGGISLYVGKRCVDKAKIISQEIEIHRWGVIIVDYHDETGESNVWVNLREIGASLKYLIDRAFPENTYFTEAERRNGFADMWIYIDASHTRRNLFGEDFLIELKNRTLRKTISRDEIRGRYESVYLFLPKSGDRAYIKSQTEYNKRFLNIMSAE